MSDDQRIRPIGRPGDPKPPAPGAQPPAPAEPVPPAKAPAQPVTPAPPAQRPPHPSGPQVREPRLTPPAMSPQVPHPPEPPPPAEPEPELPLEPEPPPAGRPTYTPVHFKAPVAAPVAHLPPPAPPPAPIGPPVEEKGRADIKANLKWAAWLAGGIAVTAGAGYLVAALWLFPAPLLPNERQVARVSGMMADDARRELERQGLVFEVTGREPSPGIGEGAVVWQDPPPGVAVPRGSTVKVILSAGLPVVAVPDVRGFEPLFAQRLIAAAGLRVEGIDTLDVKGVPPGAAGATTPAAGDSVLLGRGIILHLAPSP